MSSVLSCKASAPRLVPEDFQEVNPTEGLIVTGWQGGRESFKLNKFRERYYASVITKCAKGVCVGRHRIWENWSPTWY